LLDSQHTCQSICIGLKLQAAGLKLIYILLLWGKPGILDMPVEHKISFMEGNLFTIQVKMLVLPRQPKNII
jgi:hypothetical protein